MRPQRPQRWDMEYGIVEDLGEGPDYELIEDYQDQPITWDMESMEQTPDGKEHK